MLELEHHVELAARGVGEQPRLLERDARHLPHVQQRVAAVEDLAVHLLQELVDARAADVVLAAVRSASRVADGAVGQRGVLGDEVDDVHAEAVDPAVQPPAHHLVDRLADLRVLPVEVGLLAREQVQVVLAGRLVELPRRAGERRASSCWALGATSTSRASGCRWSERDSTNHGCSSEVWLTTRSMISRMPRSWTSASSASRSSSVPNIGSMSLVVADVVAVVVLRRGVDRRQPQHVDAELLRGGRGGRRSPPRSPIPSPSESAKLRG